MTTQKKWTVNDIKDAARANGSHWFDPDTMRSFGTRVLPTVYQGPGGIYFVTHDDQYRRELPKRYTVRTFDPDTARIGNHGELNEHSTAEEAKAAAKEAAKGGLENTEVFQPVSVIDQFCHDLQKHTNPSRGTETRTVKAAELLSGMSKKHHRYMEMLCSGEMETDADGDNPTVDRLRARITEIADGIGCKGVIFSGDPRGCTVKLVFHDGYTDDFAKEGYCVPIAK